EALSGGKATVQRTDRNAYSLPSANLAAEGRVDFAVGNSFFRNPWVIAPSTPAARDGLGPLFNTNACQNCHVRDGRGHPPEPGNSNAV
ncbi:di-heme oxidoredictase family protein, partial [Pseudomonas sp. SIMBA_065]